MPNPNIDIASLTLAKKLLLVTNEVIVVVTRDVVSIICGKCFVFAMFSLLQSSIFNLRLMHGMILFVFRFIHRNHDSLKFKHTDIFLEHHETNL